MEKIHWFWPAFFGALSLLFFNMGSIRSFIGKKLRKNSNDRNRPYIDRNPPSKNLADMKEGEKIIIVDFLDVQKPIFQFTHDYEKEKDHEQDCFVLIAPDYVNVLKKMTYMVGMTPGGIITLHKCV